jgi:hypothetical protein
MTDLESAMGAPERAAAHSSTQYYFYTIITHAATPLQVDAIVSDHRLSVVCTKVSGGTPGRHASIHLI